MLLTSAGQAPAGEDNFSIDAESGYKTNIFIPVDSAADSTRAAFHNCFFFAGAFIPSYSFPVSMNWKSSLSCDLSAAWYTGAFAIAHVLPGVSLNGNYKHNRLRFNAEGGYMLQPPDEQDPNRPTQATQLDLGAAYAVKFRNSLELGYTFTLLHEVAAARQDMKHYFKAKGTLNFGPAFRLFCKIGFASNNSTDSAARFIGWMAIPGIIFSAWEKNTVMVSFFFNQQLYQDTTAVSLKKNQSGPGNKFVVLVPHSQRTAYYCGAASIVRELLPTLDLSVQYGFSIFSPGSQMQDIASHRVSAELSWTMRPL